ncbi:3-hydroxyacyl-CoA dehydrogenase family protein [Segnochrobactrum spirostomi]|uniref:3-hydroxyacyl-CoA dehydrogenase family protein n=1 Tax=Segnochrobactrum spirostomi TaxID=2608987 RepID=A0A6A7Y9F5_9HYPH|nr:3-hydroxyacyl-CoA dehydrogenase NAD-binding domain-containing protein [Segnochrobactrum spirostomi]MQT15375.1 3-hydroxyacyl-CoA dehydrogenase family protein [Segnochrobactrum spirostomi]
MIERIGIIGGGLMGQGIAAAFALGGKDVVVHEPEAAQRGSLLRRTAETLKPLVEEDVVTADEAAAALGRIRISEGLAEAAADRQFIVEAIPERLELKQALFAELDALAPAEAVLASNTSSLPLEHLMDKVSQARRARMMLSHWYNPALIMPIVELSFFGNMPGETYDAVAELHTAIGKETVKVLKDVPGLVANRIQQGVAREVFSLIEQGIAAPEDVDRALKFGPAFRYATTGQLEVADFGGLDIWLTVGDNLLPVMDASRRANDLLRRKVADGKLGVKTGEGFYSYDPATVERRHRAFQKRLIRQLRASKAYR